MKFLFVCSLYNGKLILYYNIIERNLVTIWIKYSDNTEVTVQLWGNRIKINGIWYLLNINEIKKIIY